MSNSSVAVETSVGADLEAIKQMKARYCRFMDTKDWDGFRSLFCDDAVVDTSQATVDPLGYWDGGTLPVLTPDAITTALRDRMAGVFTCHQVHAPEIELTGPNTATGIWALEDIVRRPAGSELASFHGWGHYHETYRKVDGRWQFASVRVSRLHVHQIDDLPEQTA